MVVNLRDLVMSHEKIYSLLYSPYRVESDPLEKQITEISTESLRWSDAGIPHRHTGKAGHSQSKKL